MTSPNANQPAFPLPGESRCNGLSKREYLAGLAMAARAKEDRFAADIARISVDLADALLAELAKPRPDQT